MESGEEVRFVEADEERDGERGERVLLREPFQCQGKPGHTKTCAGKSRVARLGGQAAFGMTECGRAMLYVGTLRGSG
jgi:hypothetical protein